ncbi:MAG: VacJ family lipoprotein [Sphingomonadales bacterium]|nr:VacJ family lipoprotein [Sphingomonadales bacterium]
MPQLVAASLAAAQPAPAPASAAVPPPPIAAAAAATPDPALPAPAKSAALPGTRDPLQGFNRINYAINRPIDRFLIRPLAIAYKTVVPHPLRDGARNFVGNVFEPLVFFNDVLQLRPGRAVRTLARMALNTTLGIGGVFDVARRKPFHLPHHANGFGDTLGYYGIGPIAYLYLPVLGPTSLRDLAGAVADGYTEPRLLERMLHPDADKSLLRDTLPVGKYGIIAEGISGLDQRAENDPALQAIAKTSVDPYATLRSSYLQDRAGEIAALKTRGGEPPVPSLEDPLLDPAAAR